MPHIKKEHQVRLKTKPDTVLDYGELNAMFTLRLIIKPWEKEQSYKTIHEIRKRFMKRVINDPQTMPEESWELRRGFSELDILTARGNAWDEFYRLVVVPYENSAIAKNGNIYQGVPFATHQFGSSLFAGQTIAPKQSAKLSDAAVPMNRGLRKSVKKVGNK